jgi:predicted cupin superfamily sugar epimerase
MTPAEPRLIARRTVDGDVIEWLPEPARAATLGLEPHPEGGWYRRTWTSPATVQTPGGVRPGATLILFLLPPGEASAWHVVTSDEIWLWHGPNALALQLGGSGDAPAAAGSPEQETFWLGPDEHNGQTAQHLVPAGVWQRTLPGAGECLVSCVVSPGFSFADWSLEQGPGVNTA